MSSKEDIKLFISESEDLIQKTEEEIFKIEEKPDDIKPIQGLFFTFHTLKGLTAMAGFENLSKFCHHFESFLDNAKEKRIPMSKRSHFVDMLFESLDVLRNVIKRVKTGDMSDIDATFVQDIKDSFESFENEYDITFIQTLSIDEISQIANQKQKKTIQQKRYCIMRILRLRTRDWQY